MSPEGFESVQWSREAAPEPDSSVLRADDTRHAGHMDNALTESARQQALPDSLGDIRDFVDSLEREMESLRASSRAALPPSPYSPIPSGGYVPPPVFETHARRPMPDLAAEENAPPAEATADKPSEMPPVFKAPMGFPSIEIPSRRTYETGRRGGWYPHSVYTERAPEAPAVTAERFPAAGAAEKDGAISDILSAIVRGDSSDASAFTFLPEAPAPIENPPRVQGEGDGGVSTAGVEAGTAGSEGGGPGDTAETAWDGGKDEKADAEPLRREEESASDDGLFEAIGGRLDAGQIVSEMIPQYTENNLLACGEETYLRFDAVTSIYNIKFRDGRSRPLYDSVNAGIPRGSCTAFVGHPQLDAHALLRSTKNRAGRKSGSVLLGRRDSEGSSNLLYIENDSMVIFGMTALEFLMLCLSAVKDYPAAKQERLYNVLEDVGLSDIALVDTKLLTRLQRVALLLVTAAMSNLIDGVVLNPSRLPVEMADEFLIRKVFLLLHKTGKTVLMSGANTVLTRLVANRIVALRAGKICFDGSFSEFIDSCCPFCFSFPMGEAAAARMAAEFPAAKFERTGSRVSATLPGGNSRLAEEIVLAVTKAGVPPRDVATERGSFAAAVAGVMERDL